MTIVETDLLNLLLEIYWTVVDLSTKLSTLFYFFICPFCFSESIHFFCESASYNDADG